MPVSRSAEAEAPSAEFAPTASHSLRRRLALVGLWATAGLWMLVLAAALPARAKLWDYNIYYSSALAMREGINPYTADLTPLAQRLGFDLGKINHATDPPTFLLCFEPFTWLSPQAGFWAWTGINALAFLVALVLLLRWTPGLGGERAWIVAPLALLFPPVADHLAMGQNKMLVLLMLVLMMHWMEQRKDAAAGLILAFASLLRAFPLLLVAYLILLKRWRVLWYTIVGLAIGGLATLALVGVGRSFSFLLALKLLTERHWGALPGNIAAGPSVSRMFWYVFGSHLSPAMEWARRGVSLTVQVLILGFTVKATVGRDADGDPDWRLLALWIMAAILLSPTSWFYYLVLLTIPMVEMSAAALDGRVSARALWAGVASYALAWPYFVGVEAHSHHWAAHPQVFVWRAGATPIALLAYLSLYWFAVDQNSRTRVSAKGRDRLVEVRSQVAG
jgi:hypothetical protein